eukprot:gene6592-6446_t
MARQADGAVVVRQGNCMILATVVANKEPKPGQSFFPLTVDYQEKFASAGRIPGSFFKREARLNDYEILTSRLIDRALRPLFPDDYLCEVQVLVSLISADEDEANYIAPEDAALIGTYFHDLEKKVIRDMMLDERVRLDGRGLEDTSDYMKFILHYNFPPFSTGEVKMMRGQSRREVGHGNLAMRSLKQMMPADYPYTNGKFAVLTDILGDEDHLGDMDFKVTGTRDGICGIQMDIKVDGLSMEIMMQALEQARRGRLHILDAMYETIEAPRADLKPHAPRITQLNIDREFIGAVIGPGGKIIQEMQRETNTKINIEEVGNEGVIKIFATNQESVDKAVIVVMVAVAVTVETVVMATVETAVMVATATVAIQEAPAPQGGNDDADLA